MHSTCLYTIKTDVLCIRNSVAPQTIPIRSVILLAYT